jgi:hypothetical protein
MRGERILEIHTYICQNPGTMYRLSTISIFLAIFFVGISAGSQGARGEIYTFSDVATSDAVRFSNENWYSLPHPKVATVSFLADGTVTGLTENGIHFVQYKVPNTLGVRVERFEIQDHYHYIVEGEIADTFEELSVLLATAYLQG